MKHFLSTVLSVVLVVSGISSCALTKTVTVNGTSRAVIRGISHHNILSQKNHFFSIVAKLLVEFAEPRYFI